MSDIEREAFEKWSKNEFPHMWLERKGDTGDYLYKTAKYAYSAWQAARQAPASGEVELAEHRALAKKIRELISQESFSIRRECRFCHTTMCDHAEQGSELLEVDDVVRVLAEHESQAHPPAKVPDVARELIQTVLERAEQWERGEKLPDDHQDWIDRAKALLSATPETEWPAMPDKFYEGLGWMHAECCAALDRGEDPRGFEIGEMVQRCIRDLTADPQEQ